LIPWIIFAGISTIYSYYWDLKKDWGFLQPNSKYKFLRNELSYHNPLLYYIGKITKIKYEYHLIAIVLNLVMRLAWALSISPDIVSQVIRPELVSFGVGFVEIIRRSVWNFLRLVYFRLFHCILRVEKEHLANVGNFRVVQDMKLPYSDISFEESTEEVKVL